jgi:hypothetical protein
MPEHPVEVLAPTLPAIASSAVTTAGEARTANVEGRATRPMGRQIAQAFLDGRSVVPRDEVQAHLDLPEDKPTEFVLDVWSEHL